MMTISVLGSLRVSDGRGHELATPGGREGHALAVLALVAPESVSTERLADELYHDSLPNDPRNAVQAVISRLRRALGPGSQTIETTAGGYRLVDVVIDLDEAEALLRRAVTDADPGRAADAFDRATAMWRGPTLAGLHGPSIDAERLKIDGLRLDAEDALLARRIEQGLDPDLPTALDEAARAEPLRERRWELLMTALYRQGRQADALRAYQDARAVLADRLGLEPGPALARLEQRILAHDPTLWADTSAATTGFPGADPAAAGDPARATSHGGSGPPGDPSRATTDGATLPAGTVSVLLCDVEGSVRRWEQSPDDTAGEIDRLHRLWSIAVGDRNGHLVKSTGDGIMAVFATAADAVRAAAAGARAQEQTGLSVRVAVHTGSMTPVDRDYRGPVVNRCARLLDLAHGGQILITGTTARLARDEVVPLRFRDLGLQWLRDVPDPIEVHQVEGSELRSTFPPLRSTGPQSLPRLRTTLVGRDSLLDTAVDRVGSHGLVTLVGPGGIGKTSLAVATGWRVAPLRPVCFVDLAGVNTPDGLDGGPAAPDSVDSDPIDPDTVAERIVEVLAPSEHDDRDAVERIADRLSTGTDLVIIDNAEHLLDAVTAALEPVLRHELKGSFLVTSRQPLGLVDEELVAIPPLLLPDDAADLAVTGDAPAVQLFVDRVLAARPDFEIPTGLLPVVAHVCRRLDGIPLAIELAAGRAALLSLDDIAARLDDQLRLLRQVRSSRDDRHRSLEAVVGWSIDQLSPDGRELFDRLAVMMGGFALTGVERLVEHCGLDLDPLHSLDELRAASLIVVETGGSRFRMLEPIRQVAESELRRRGLTDATRRAHAEWVIDMVTEAHELRDERRVPAVDLVDRESRHLLAAIRWIAATHQSDLAVRIAFPSSFWFLTRDARTGARLLASLLDLVDRDDDPTGWAEVVIAVAAASASHPLSQVGDDALEAVEILEAAGFPDAGLACVAAAVAQVVPGRSPAEILELLARAERLTSSDDGWASAVVDLAIVAVQGLLIGSGVDEADPEAAIDRGERAAATFRRLDETWSLGLTLGELGRIHKAIGNLELAEASLLESVELFANADDHAIHYLYTELGRLATMRGEHELADDYHHRALEIATIDGNGACISEAVTGLAESAEARGDLRRAHEHYREALHLAEASGQYTGRGASELRVAVERLAPQARTEPRSGGPEPV